MTTVNSPSISRSDRSNTVHGEEISFKGMFLQNRAVKITLTILFTVLGTMIFALFSIWFILFGTPVTQEFFVKQSAIPVISDSISQVDKQYDQDIASARKELQKLNTTYTSLTPSQPFLVINTTKNHFFLYNKKEVIREGFCSSGSYIQLKSNDDREWIFKTPKGMRTVKGKTTSPVWRKPDWAFIEDGLPVPSGDHPSRYERGVLGDYALSLGDGYLIHGTIYKRFLGMPVTHGCVRLSDDDLEQVYKTLSIGSKVYIY
ncbi:MAG: L,D-transpeptidase [Bacteroidales bacterium]|nr:L,D-transpeptidase [Bacteroidales bacterium]